MKPMDGKNKKNLQMYVDEFVFSFNIKDLKKTQYLMLANTEHRLTYKSLING